MSDLTFRALREANLRRCQAPIPQGLNHQLMDWSALEWAGAMCGEAGEAANKSKKLWRREHPESNPLGDAGLSDERAVGKEIADAIIYADLLAARIGLTLEEVVRWAFNDKSVEIGSDIRL